MSQATVSKKNSETKFSAFKLQCGQRLREGLFLFTPAVALYFLVSLLSYSPTDPGWSNSGTGVAIRNVGGPVGAWSADFFLYMFGYVAYLFPFIAMMLAWLWFKKSESQERDYSLLGLKFIGFICVLTASCALASLHLTAEASLLPFTAGGIVGQLLGQVLVSSFDLLGSTLLLIAMLLCGFTWFTGLSWFIIGQHLLSFLIMMGHKAKQQLFSLLQQVHPWVMRFKSKLSAKREGKGLHEPFSPPAEPRVPVPEMRFLESQAHEVSESLLIPKPATKAPSVAYKEKTPEPSIPKRKITGKIPGFELLTSPKLRGQSDISQQLLEHLSGQVEQRLLDFGVDVKVVAIHPGPVITRFELALAPGVKVSKLSGLAKDLARSLSVMSVRIVEVIPGKTVVGLEIPNETREIVYFREVLESKIYVQAHSPLSLGLGKDIAGHPVVVDLAKMPHLLVAGTTGSGKSVGVNAMLMSILFKATPEEVRLILVDPKMLELSIYEGIPHLLTPVVTDMKEAASALRWCVAEMERRYRLMASLGVRNLAGFNRKVREAAAKGSPITDPFRPTTPAGEPIYLEALPFIVVIIDEFADMMMVVGKKVEQLIARIAQKARAAGIHLILATQRPSVDVITGLIKANIPTRMAFQVSSKVDSRTILDQPGAEQLLGLGDMLYLAPGTGVPTRVHGAFVSDEEVHNVVKNLKQSNDPPDYIEEILDGNLDNENSQELAIVDQSSGEQDSLYDEAVAFVTKTRRASISSVQRRFKIGYNRAARIIEEMEQAHVVSPMESNGSREVLAPPPPE